MSKNVPEVRFKGFREEWRPINLSKLMDFSNGINAPKESYGKGRKMISVMDILDNSYLKYENIRSSVEVSPSIEEKNKVEYGDLIFVRSSEVSEEVGWSKAYLESEYALYSGFSIRGKRKGSFNPSFVELSLNYKNRKQIERKAGGSTRFNISQTILNTIEILEATYEEQQKIGDFFKQLDYTIALQQQLVEQQQQYKKAMLQKMFPQKGERVPKFRFDGFSGEWEETRLSSLFESRDIKQIPTTEAPLMAFTSTGGVEEKGERFNREFLVKDKNKTCKRTELNDLIYSSNNLDVGAIGRNKYGTAVISDVYEIFQTKNSTTPEFSEIIIKQKNFLNKVLKYRQGALYGQYRIYASDFLSVNTLIPSFKEQQKIGVFFKQLDDTIALHQKKLKDYQQLKKALLQRMFV